MKACPVCRQYCADQKTFCPKCGGSLESASDFHRAHPEQHDHEINELTAALARDPGDSAARRKLIDLYQAQSNWPQVAAHLRVLADADPHDAALQTALVDVLGLAGRGAEAALVLRGLLVKYPDDQGLRQKLDDILTWLPLEGLEAAHQPPLAELWVEAGDAKRKAGDLDAAADLYHKAQIADEHSGALRRLAEVYGQQAAHWEQQGRSDLALAALETAIRCAPDDGALAARRDAILSRRKRRRIMAVTGSLIALLLLAGLSAYQYGYQGTVNGHLSIPAKAALVYDGWGGVRYTSNPFQMTWQRRGEAVWQGDADRFATALIPGGRYRLIVEKPGYRHIEQPVTVGWGRKAITADAALTPAYGGLKVSSDPAGALVRVRNDYEATTGTTPCVIERLHAMPATIIVALPGSGPDQAVTKEHTIVEGQTLDLGTVTLTGGLKVDSKPSGGEVFIDGKQSGTTPLELAALTATRHTLEIRKPGAGLYVQDLAIKPGAETDLGAVAFSELGVLRIDAKDGANVSLDGKQLGRTPLTLGNVSPGEHQVILWRAHGGYTGFQKRLTFAAGQVHDLGTIEFEGSLKIASEPTGAEVYLNNEKIGTTPFFQEKLPSKMGELELRIGEIVVYKDGIGIPPQETLDLGTLKFSLSPVIQPVVASMRNGHTATMEISQVDDDAAVFLNGQKLLAASLGQGPQGPTIPDLPGRTGVVDITNKLRNGPNEMQFRIANKVGDTISGFFSMRVDDQVVYFKGIHKKDPKQGIGFQDKVTLLWPPVDSAKQQSLNDYDPFFSGGSSGKASPRSPSERGTSRELVMKDGMTTEKMTVGRVTASTQEKASSYLSLATDKISSNFKPPQTRPDTTCEIGCMISKTGEIRDTQVKRSAGTPEWDQWAVEAIKQAKLPPLYDNIKADAIPVTITFDYAP